MKAYAQIILAKMEHMENDRYWSLEEAEMLEMGEEPEQSDETVDTEDDMELPFN